MDWVKIRCDISDNRKIKQLRSGPEGNNLFLLWLLTILEAGKCNRGGYLMISNNYAYSEETLNIQTGIALPTVRLGLNAFTELEMIDWMDKAIFLKNWRKYQSEDVLEVRREKERIRQQRHRAKEREKMKALPLPFSMSRDNETLLSRDVTLENRQDKRRIEKTTTTEKALSLFSGAVFAKIPERELESLEKRHGQDRFLLTADVAAETWRRDHEDRHNPGGYLHSLCSSLVVPDWYVPFEERLKISQEKRQRQKAMEDEVYDEKQKIIAMDALWASLSDEAREAYLKKASVDQPEVVRTSPEVIMILAKSEAWDDAQARKYK
jgi:predicted phage replisome organizer